MAGIEEKLHIGLTKESSSTKASETVTHLITDKRAISFGIHDQTLKSAIDIYYGKHPDHAYIRDHPDHTSLFERYGWEQMKTVLTVDSVELMDVTSVPEIIAKKTFTNNSSTKATFTGEITQQVENTTEANWSNTNTITVGSTSSVTIELDPHESKVVQLTANKGVMKVRIVYEASLAGSVAVDYRKGYKDHHYWVLDISATIEAANINNSLKITEDIEIAFY